MYEGYSKTNLRFTGKKEIKNGEKNFIAYKTYIHNCITFPHSHHPNSGICHTVASAYAIPHQRTMPPGYPVVDFIHELLIGFEALGSQPNLRLTEEIVLVITRRRVRAVREVILFARFNWEIFNYSPLPSLPVLRNQWGVYGINNWLGILVVPFFDEGLQKLMPRYDKPAWIWVATYVKK